jgi:hypothetical protein
MFFTRPNAAGLFRTVENRERLGRAGLRTRHRLIEKSINGAALIEWIFVFHESSKLPRLPQRAARPEHGQWPNRPAPPKSSG